MKKHDRISDREGKTKRRAGNKVLVTGTQGTRFLNTDIDENGFTGATTGPGK